MALEWPSHTALRFLLTGADTLHRYPSTNLPFKLINNYGPTECTVVATSGTVQPGVSRDALPTIGRPIANTHVYILDENLQQVPCRHCRRTAYRRSRRGARLSESPGLDCGKVHSESVQQSGWKGSDARLYKTGDLARYLPNGEIAYVGRIDDQIKIMGYRIEPNEIVALLNRHPAVQASVVLAREATRVNACSERQLVAYVTLDTGSQTTSGELRSFLRVELPDYMVPSVFVHLESLPLTPEWQGGQQRATRP